MSDLESLYRAEILSFARVVRDAAPLSVANASAVVLNPHCGDEVEVDLLIEGGVIKALSVRICGCSICEASAGFVLGALRGLEAERVRHLPDEVADFLRDGGAMPLAGGAAFASIRPFKLRHSCVLLVYEAVAKAIDADRLV